jgi:hypothetical protein
MAVSFKFFKSSLVNRTGTAEIDNREEKINKKSISEFVGWEAATLSAVA